MKHPYLVPLRYFLIMPFSLLSSFIPRTLLAAGTGATLRALKSALLSLLLIAGGAHAAFVTWTIDGATFDDGTTLTGSFEYDASSNTYRNWNIVTTAGSRPALSYTSSPNNSGANLTNSQRVVFQNSSGAQAPLWLYFRQPLSDAGTSTNIAIDTSSYAYQGTTSTNRSYQTGTVNGTNVTRNLLTGRVTVAPTVSSIRISGSSITRGPAAGGSAVTITGTKFTGATGVTVGGSACTNVVVVSDTSITCTTPAGTAGAASVLVTTPDGTSAANPNAPWNYYVVPAPSVTSISPAFGPTAGGSYVVMVDGANFKGDGYQATGLSFGGTPLTFGTGWSINNGSQIAVLSIPPGATGSVVDITVTTVSGTSSTSAASRLTYIDPPTVTSVSPASGTTAGGTSVTITGTNFLGLSGASAVKFGTTNAASYSVDSATQITAIAPAGVTGSVNISVRNPVGTSSPLAANLYAYAVPVPAPIPTLSEWAMIFMTSLMLMLGFRKLRSKRS